jgi:hypothetical protein
VCANPVQSQAGLPAAVTTTKNSHTLPQTAGQDNLSQPCSNDCLEVPTAFASTDCVLTWPIFGGRWPRDYLSLDLLVGNFQFQNTNSEQASDRRDKRPYRGISEEEIPRLVEQFLGRVHSKNPIFHTRQIREDARRVAEDGVRWDASSCVVVRAYFNTVQLLNAHASKISCQYQRLTNPLAISLCARSNRTSI